MGISYLIRLKNKCQESIDKEPSHPTEQEKGYTVALMHIVKLIDDMCSEYESNGKTMKGKLKQKENKKWVVVTELNVELPVLPESMLITRCTNGKLVNFKIYPHWETGLEEVINFAKLLPDTHESNYPELEGTLNLCNEMIMKNKVLNWLKNRFTKDAPLSYVISEFEKETDFDREYISKIEEWAWSNPCLSRKDVHLLFEDVFKDKVIDGSYKISASKQVYQFKNRLRNLVIDNAKKIMLNDDVPNNLISDNEIKKEAIKYTSDFPNWDLNRMIAFISACKWYREKLKSKQ